MRLSVLVQSRAGFTVALSQHMYTVLHTFIDRPYSALYSFREYGTVIMLASGIGIAGHMLYIKDLIRGYNSYKVQTCCILVV